MATLTKDEQRQKIEKMLGKHNTAMLVTHDKQGGLVSRPMTTQQTNFDNDLVWFFVSSDADVIDEIEANDEVNIAYAAKNNFVSVTGSASIVEDAAKKKAMWYDELKKWFGGAEPESAHVKLIKVKIETGRYWDTAANTGSEDGSPIEEGTVSYE